jgi:hypothetical protein
MLERVAREVLGNNHCRVPLGFVRTKRDRRQDLADLESHRQNEVEQAREEVRVLHRVALDAKRVEEVAFLAGGVGCESRGNLRVGSLLLRFTLIE